MAVDLIGDAHARLAREPKRKETHSEVCHQRHDACLIARLVVRAAILEQMESKPARYWLVESHDARDQVFFSLDGAREAARELEGATITELVPRRRVDV